MPKENNKMQVDIDTLKKQNVNDLLSIKELYKRIEELGEKITQIKYIDNTLVKKLKKDYEKFKKIILDENIQVELLNNIKQLKDTKANKDVIETINSQMDNINNQKINFKTLNKGRIAFIFDDGYKNIYENAFPILKENNFPFSIAFDTGRIKEQKPNRLTLNQILEMKNSGLLCALGHGHDIFKYDDSHTDDESINDLQTCKDYLKYLGFDVKGFVAPEGVSTKSYDLFRKVFDYGFINYKTDIINKSNDTMNLNRISLENLTIEQIKSYINKAESEQGVLVLYSHHVADGQLCTVEKFTQVINYIKTKNVLVKNLNTIIDDFTNLNLKFTSVKFKNIKIEEKEEKNNLFDNKEFIPQLSNKLFCWKYDKSSYTGTLSSIPTSGFPSGKFLQYFQGANAIGDKTYLSQKVKFNTPMEDTKITIGIGVDKDVISNVNLSIIAEIYNGNSLIDTKENTFDIVELENYFKTEFYIYKNTVMTHINVKFCIIDNDTTKKRVTLYNPILNISTKNNNVLSNTNFKRLVNYQFTSDVTFDKHGSYQNLPFNNKIIDTFSNYNTSNNRFVTDKVGIFECEAILYLKSDNETDIRTTFFINGVQKPYAGSKIGNSYSLVNLKGIYELDVNGFIDIKLWQPSSNNITLLAGSSLIIKQLT